jgi:hypothetical protein
MHRLLIILLLFIAPVARSQTKITWETLEDVRFTEKYSEEVKANFYYPQFGRSVKALEGKKVILRGYLLVIDRKEGFYILSRYPYSSCFFCGKGGPESIVELELAPDQPRFKMDQIVTISGTFALNQDDIYQCNYIIKEAESYKPDL